ncbi:MAG: hypothetical protein CMI53_04245 [Parcubacteria group bacterium]|nr:hypothetical protein [Parcubacteria group bacterium]|tara:strand:+ start:363 stop:866 length:504 start_codon:yes stop_codon:yes gene_type:complete
MDESEPKLLAKSLARQELALEDFKKKRAPTSIIESTESLLEQARLRVAESPEAQRLVPQAREWMQTLSAREHEISVSIFGMLKENLVVFLANRSPEKDEGEHDEHIENSLMDESIMSGRDGFPMRWKEFEDALESGRTLDALKTLCDILSEIQADMIWQEFTPVPRF